MHILTYECRDRAPVGTEYMAKIAVDMVPSDVAGRVTCAPQDRKYIQMGLGQPDGSGMLPRVFFGVTSGEVWDKAMGAIKKLEKDTVA